MWRSKARLIFRRVSSALNTSSTCIRWTTTHNLQITAPTRQSQGDELRLDYSPIAKQLRDWNFAIPEDKRQATMNAGGAFGGNRGLKPVPPEKGVFPLDHLLECDREKKAYMECLKSSDYKSEKCRHFSKKYLECRMERNLMAKQDISELGFREVNDSLKAEVTNVDNEGNQKGQEGESIAGIKS